MISATVLFSNTKYTGVKISEFRYRANGLQDQVIVQVVDSTCTIINLAPNKKGGAWGYLKDDGNGSKKELLSIVQLAFTLDLPVTLEIDTSDTYAHACITEIQLKNR